MRPRVRAPRVPRHGRAYSRPRARPPVVDAVRQSLAADEASGALSVDHEKGTVSAAGAELPLSPIMDTRLLDRQDARRGPKPRPKGTEDTFRKELHKSLFARALATPVRSCSITRVRMPTAFLQEFRPVHPPSGDRPWWAPEGLLPTAPAAQGAVTSRSDDDGGGKVVQQHGKGPASRTVLRADVITPQPDIPRKRESVSMQMMSPRTWRFGKFPGGQPPVWRERMGEVVLEGARRAARDRLAGMAARAQADVAERPDVSETARRPREPELVGMDYEAEYARSGYVLWTPPEEGSGGLCEGQWTRDLEGVGSPGVYATIRTAPASESRDLPIYNLRLLLGPDHLEALRAGHALFRENRMVLVKNSGEDEAQRALWRLQGLLAGLAGA